MTSEEQRRYLERLIEENLSISSDESEGTQAVTMDRINVCSPDYTDEGGEPQMTLPEIQHMLHMDDPDIFPEQAKRKYPKDNDGTGSSLAEGGAGNPDKETTSLPQPTREPGTGYEGADDDTAPEEDLQPDDYITDKDIPEELSLDDIRYPEGTDADRIAQAVIDDPSIGPVDCIIEFAQPCIRDKEGVDFSWCVKPGDTVTLDTVIAKATIDGSQKKVRSIFSSGTVSATQDGKSFERLLPEAGTNRHIIIRNCEISGDIPEVHTDEIEKVQEQFRKEAQLFEVIVDNLCESMLPWILLRRKLMPEPGLMNFLSGHNGREIFGEFLEYVEGIREEYAEDLKNMASEKNIKSSSGRISSLNGLGQKILDRRKKFALDIISAYCDYSESLEECEYDNEYSDCMYLAYVHPIPKGDDETHTAVGDDEYNNYYVALLARLDMNTDNPYCRKYYKILTDIIGKRIATEGYEIDDIKTEFNRLFMRNMSGTLAGAYEKLDSAMKEIKGDVTNSDVSSWISENLEPRKKDEYTSIAINQMTNIYMFIRNYNARDYRKKEYKSNRITRLNPTTNLYETIEENTGIFELTKEENAELVKFWDEIISEFLATDLDNIIADVRNIPDRLQEYATWPIDRQVTIRNHNYRHYLFENSVRISGDGVNDEIGGQQNETIPPEPTEVNPPEAGPDILPTNENDPQPDEISIKDFDYWSRYFALATVISIPFLNCGIDMLTSFMNIPLPCIFICIGCVYIQILDVVIVFGISIRGMYVWPIILFVNTGNQYCNVLTPLIAMLKNIQAKISAKLDALTQSPIESIADMYINMLENENRNLLRQNKQMDVVLSQIQTRKTENQEEITRRIEKLVNPKKRSTQKIIDPEAGSR